MKISMFILVATSILSNVAWAQCQSKDISYGQKQFNRCIACHSIKANEHKMGPSLHGLMGRKVASIKGFTYSPALKSKNFVWNEESLNKFLMAPQSFLPGTVMPFAGIKKQKQRDAIACYINTLNKKQ